MTDPTSAELRHGIDQRLGAMSGFTAELAAIRGRATAAQGLIDVEVTSAGRITSLRLDPRAMRLASEDLTAQIMAAVNAATAEAATQVAAATAAAFGENNQNWDDLIGGAPIDPSVPLPDLPDLTEFEAAIKAQAAALGAIEAAREERHDDRPR